jgi:SAM-dependent methyltransferase
MTARDAEVRRRRELEEAFWRTSPDERPEADSLWNLVNKAQEAAVFLELVERYREVFAGARSVLELGGGQGWASCIVKRLFPDASVTATDLSPDAIASAPKWERVYDVSLDATRAYASDALDEADSSHDVVFCFAAAHHFVEHEGTLREIARVLRPRGTALYLYEPSCPAFLYEAALWRVTRKRPDVPEDVLKYDEIAALARTAGLTCAVEFFPSARHRGPVETLYYAVVGRSEFLQRRLPCTANYVFTKP